MNTNTTTPLASHPSTRLTWLALAALGLIWLSGCGASVYSPRGNVGLDLNPAFEINDDDIRKAYEARPQLPKQLKVAYLSFDDENNDALDEALRKVPGVAEVYRIPELMVSGERRYEQRRHYSPWEQPKPLSIKKLRLLAARARCDVLLIVDNGHRIENSPNGLIALSPLIVPVFIAPMTDVEVESYMEAFLIDVRNGYLYGHIQADQRDTEDYETIFSSYGAKKADAHYDTLLKEITAELADLIKAEREAPIGAP
ncbi:MAG: hypothetical protein CMH57_05970 [Myxococcales bacterium]|nr:hypothetical protein [Myxococcales bacterium]